MPPRGVRAPSAAALAAQGAVLAALAFIGAFALLTGEALGGLLVVGTAVAALGGALLGGVPALRPWRAVLWLVAGAVAVVTLAVAGTPVMRPLARAVVRRDAPMPVDAVVALSSGLTSSGLLSNRGLERLIDASRLARSLDVPLVLSIIHPIGRSDVSSYPDQQALTAALGVRRLATVDSVHTTHDEAVHVATLARRNGWRRVAVVTSPLHSRRACATFERAGLTVRCAPARARDMVLDGPQALTGNAERVRAFASWLHEALGLVWYRYKDWA